MMYIVILCKHHDANLVLNCSISLEGKLRKLIDYYWNLHGIECHWIL